MAQAHDRIVETGREARQGYRDRPVLAVVGVSLALAVIALTAVWMGFFTH